MCTHIERHVYVCITIKGSAIIREVYASSNRQERNNERAKARGNVALTNLIRVISVLAGSRTPGQASKPARRKFLRAFHIRSDIRCGWCRIVLCCACAVLVPRRAAPCRAVLCRAVSCPMAVPRAPNEARV